MNRAAIVQQLAATGWSQTAAAELADIHLQLQARKAAEAAAALRPSLPVQATGHAFHEVNGGQPRLPLARLALLVLVSCALLLTACGGGGDAGPGGDAVTGHVPTPTLNCQSVDPATGATTTAEKCL